MIFDDITKEEKLPFCFVGDRYHNCPSCKKDFRLAMSVGIGTKTVLYNCPECKSTLKIDRKEIVFLKDTY